MKTIVWGWKAEDKQPIDCFQHQQHQEQEDIGKYIFDGVLNDVPSSGTTRADMFRI